MVTRRGLGLHIGDSRNASRHEGMETAKNRETPGHPDGNHRDAPTKCVGVNSMRGIPFLDGALFRGTEVPLPLLKQGAPTENSTSKTNATAGQLPSVMAGANSVVSTPSRFD